MKVIRRQKIDGRVPVFPAASTHLCFTQNRPSRHNEVFLFVFLNCVVCSRLLWAASFGSLFVLLCGSWCSPGRKKTQQKNTGPAADATCTFVCARAWVCARRVASGYSAPHRYCGPTNCCSELRHSVRRVASYSSSERNALSKLGMAKVKVGAKEDLKETWVRYAADFADFKF